MLNVQERLNSKTYVHDGHLLWAGALSGGGYGSIWTDGSPQKTHRVAWEIAYGPIPEGKLVLHRCNIPPCLLPWHLYLGTQADNIQDVVAAGNHREARKTHCPRGHPYTEDNTRLWQGERHCRACGRARYWESLQAGASHD